MEVIHQRIKSLKVRDESVKKVLEHIRRNSKANNDDIPPYIAGEKGYGAEAGEQLKKSRDELLSYYIGLTLPNPNPTPWERVRDNLSMINIGCMPIALCVIGIDFVRKAVRNARLESMVYRHELEEQLNSTHTQYKQALDELGRNNTVENKIKALEAGREYATLSRFASQGDANITLFDEVALTNDINARVNLSE